MMSEIDSVTLEVLRNSFRSIADAMGIAIWRTAYSTIVRDSRDCSAGLCDAHGQLIAQADLIPALSGAMHLSLKVLLKDSFPLEEIREGDVFLLNHPYYGGTHTSDIILYSPIFVEGDIIAFAVSIAHHIDLGSMQATGLAIATDLYQEGLLLPPLKLYEEGRLNETLIRMLEANVRYPKEVLGDLRAQTAANSLGVREMLSLVDKHGKGTVVLAMREVLQYGEKVVRSEIAKIPDGEYQIEGFLDDDGIELGKPIRVKVKIKVEGGDITYDFTGSDPQAKGNINCVPTAVIAALGYATKCVSGTAVEQNEGTFVPLRWILPRGSIVNPIAPAPCGRRHILAQRIADTLIEGFAQGMPERVPAASCGNTCTFTIVYGDGIHYSNLGGGFGATCRGDGMSAIQVHLSKCMALPIEDVELMTPSFIESSELIQDSGGPGEYRGGQGVRQDVRVLADEAALCIISDAENHPPLGLFGGKPGKPGRKYLNPGTAQEKRLCSKTVDFRLKKGDVVSLRTPGGGGYGSPLKRDPSRVLEDVLDGKVSSGGANEHYGVVIDVDERQIKEKETSILRQRLGSQDTDTELMRGPAVV